MKIDNLQEVGTFLTVNNKKKFEKPTGENSAFHDVFT